MLGMLEAKDNHFGFISNLIVRKYCYTEDEIRRQAIQAIVSRTSNGRPKKAVKTVNELVALLQKEPFFKSISTHFKVMTEISQNALYEQHWQGEAIFSIGDEGRHFYLVLAGTVHLTVPDEIEGIEK